MIYVASPYSHKDHEVMIQRFEAVALFCGGLMKAGKIVYSPITHNHPIAVRVELPRTWEWWKTFDEHILRRCDELYVLQLEGWDSSVGVAAEIEIAKLLKIPISHHRP